MEKPAHPDEAILAQVEAAAVGVLTLAEGLNAQELARSRITLAEVRRGLLEAATGIASLSAHALESMPELDAPAWSRLRVLLEQGLREQAEAAWLAIEALAPATIVWIRLYRSATSGSPGASLSANEPRNERAPGDGSDLGPT